MRTWDEVDEAFGTMRSEPIGAPGLATPYEWRDPSRIEPRDWLHGRDVLRGYVGALVAPGAAGKTIFSVARALALVTGRPLLGKRVHGGPKRAWIWNLEDDLEEVSRIIQAACKHWSITPADIGGRLFIDTALGGKPLRLASSGGPDGLQFDTELIMDLTDELRSRRIDYFHVDPFVSSHAVDENSNMEIDKIVKEWALLAHTTSTAVCLAHHTSKAGSGEVTALSARGAVALMNACRTGVTINRMTEEEAARYGIEGGARRRYFRVYDDKSNRAPPADDSDWYRLHSVDLENATEDREGDSVGVVVPWSPPDAFEGVTTDHLSRVQGAVAEGEWREHYSAANWVGRAVAAVLGLDADAKADRVRISSLLKAWIQNGALRVEERKDGKTRQVKRFVVVGEAAI